MSRANKVTHYKVWIHIEGLNADGDTVEGDEYFEPHEVGAFDTAEEAEELRCKLGSTADIWSKETE